MQYPIKITPAAFRDIQQGIEYYTEKSNKPGQKFLSTVDATVDKIAEYPLAASFAYNQVRYKLVKGFPYVIFYRSTDTEVIILRIFNTFLKPI
ncbi:MAG TPA: type II toxin-antitoxin system RelE/ParE family toxin [Flavipsychrobacter sp.]|nr:type II toxin-antitoxin system RelE/ParE family toxin [Flavipsychrobacter sp.]